MTQSETSLRIEQEQADPPAILMNATRAMSPHEIMIDMARTFKERNAVYGDNYRMVAKLMLVLFPEGLPPGLYKKDQFHLFELVLVKLSRFAISNLTHRDSVHDMAVYAAMVESVITEQGATK